MSNRRIVLMLVSILGLLLLATPTAAELPPRPTPEPEATLLPPERTSGGWIELRAQNAKVQMTLVQWQDGAGKWIDVDSWRGTFDSVSDGVGKKAWWIDQANFGTTLFRWVVYDAASNQVAATSQPFKLPTENKQTVTIQVVLAP